MADLVDKGSRIIEETIDITPTSHADDLDDFYEINRTVCTIIDGGYQSVALQFPDELLVDASQVFSRLQELIPSNVRIFILGDTSFGQCCVDEVAAQHLGATLVVHYGRACMSSTSRLPVLYIFGKQAINILQCSTSIMELSQQYTRVLVLYDTCYTHAVPGLLSALQGNDDITIVPLAKNTFNVVPPEVDANSPISSQSSVCSCTPNCEVKCCDEGDGQKTTIQESETTTEPEEKGIVVSGFFIENSFLVNENGALFYIGSESRHLTSILLKLNKYASFIYNTEIDHIEPMILNTSRELKRRHLMMHKAKGASIIGILVGTLGVSRYLDAIEELKALIKQSGRKHYTFVVGKVNVPKLANFSEIDAFVIVACPENSLIDSKEFLKPIVTPFELHLALSDCLEWTGDYEADFSILLPSMKQIRKRMQESSQEEIQDESVVQFSVVTGQMETVSLWNGQSAESDAISNDLVVRNKETQLSTRVFSPAAQFLSQRVYQGLDPRIGEESSVEVQEGANGVAWSYCTELRD